MKEKPGTCGPTVPYADDTHTAKISDAIAVLQEILNKRGDLRIGPDKGSWIPKKDLKEKMHVDQYSWGEDFLVLNSRP